MIVIIGPDKEFTHTLAEQVVRELAVACECVSSPAELEKTDISVAELLVASESYPSAPLPVLTLSRPIIMREALAEIAGRLAAAKAPQPVGVGLVFNAREKILTHTASGKSVSLTDKEAQLLSALTDEGNKGIAKDALLKRVWGIEAALNTHTLETHIYRLRGKLRELSGEDMIAVSEGGYRLAQ